MSEHSKWHNIAQKKGKTDAQRAKIFTKLSREIIVAVKTGGANPDANSKLKDIIAKAKSNNVPAEIISAALLKKLPAQEIPQAMNPCGMKDTDRKEPQSSSKR